MRICMTTFTLVFMWTYGTTIRADPPKGYTIEDVEQKDGTILAIKILKGGRREVTVKSSEEKSTFMVDRLTMSYYLTARNPRSRKI